ncbi:hypothetical protein SO802_009111 [Lithocarpus litseifolius]|uniref:Uncharacterized protein n=1 Tax=Lithocarpus litseifolius TaxID=425828 RepID=A0AAW2DBV8_9ROSI
MSRDGLLDEQGASVLSEKLVMANGATDTSQEKGLQCEEIIIDITRVGDPKRAPECCIYKIAAWISDRRSRLGSPIRDRRLDLRSEIAAWISDRRSSLGSPIRDRGLDHRSEIAAWISDPRSRPGSPIRDRRLDLRSEIAAWISDPRSRLGDGVRSDRRSKPRSPISDPRSRLGDRTLGAPIDVLVGAGLGLRQPVRTVRF